MQRTWKRLAGVKDLRAMDLLAAAAVAGGLVHELSGDEDEALQVKEKSEFDDKDEDTEKGEGGGEDDRESELSEVEEDDPRDAYKPSPRKTRTRSEEVEAADAEGGNGKAPFRMPPAGTRVSMDYEDGEFHGTVFNPEGWKQGEILIAFDDGDHCSLNQSELKKAFDLDKYREVGADHPLRDVGCLQSAAAARVGDLQTSKVRGGGVRVDGVWIGQKEKLGKEQLQGYESFVGSDGSRAEFKTFVTGTIVVVEDEVCVLLRVMKCPVEADPAGKARLVALVTPLGEAMAGVMPCITAAFTASKTALQFVPFAKVTPVRDGAPAGTVTEAQRAVIVQAASEMGAVIVGDVDYQRARPDGALMAQLNKVLENDVAKLDAILIRGQMQPKRASGKRPRRNLEEELGETSQDGSPAPSSVGSGRGGSGRGGAGNGRGARGGGGRARGAGAGRGGRGPSREEIMAKQVSDMKKQLADMSAQSKKQATDVAKKQQQELTRVRNECVDRVARARAEQDAAVAAAAAKQPPQTTLPQTALPQDTQQHTAEPQPLQQQQQQQQQHNTQQLIFPQGAGSGVQALLAQLQQQLQLQAEMQPAQQAAVQPTQQQTNPTPTMAQKLMLLEQLAVLRGKMTEETDRDARVRLAGEISRCEFKLANNHYW